MPGLWPGWVLLVCWSFGWLVGGFPSRLVVCGIDVRQFDRLVGSLTSWFELDKLVSSWTSWLGVCLVGW